MNERAAYGRRGPAAVRWKKGKSDREMTWAGAVTFACGIAAAAVPAGLAPSLSHSLGEGGQYRA